MVNLTKINDKKFYKLHSQITWLEQSKKHIRQCRLISSEKINSSNEAEKIYSAKIECPFCGQIRQYERCVDNSLNSFFFCYNCTSVSKIPSSKLFLNDYNTIATNLNYFKLFLLAYLLRFKFYRKHRTKIISTLIKWKKLIIPLFSIVKKAKK